MKFSKKILFFGVFIFFCIVAFIVVNNFWMTSSDVGQAAHRAIETHNPGECDILPTEVELQPSHDDEMAPSFSFPRDACLILYLAETADPSSCEKMYYTTNRNMCYKYSANIYSDPTWCDEFKDWSDNRQYIHCRAIATRDISECDILDTLGAEQKYIQAKIFCINDVVFRTGEYRLCSKIDSDISFSDSYKRNCFEAATCKWPELEEEICEYMQSEGQTLSKLECFDLCLFYRDLWTDEYEHMFKIYK